MPRKGMTKQQEKGKWSLEKILFTKNTLAVTKFSDFLLETRHESRGRISLWKRQQKWLFGLIKWHHHLFIVQLNSDIPWLLTEEQRRGQGIWSNSSVEVGEDAQPKYLLQIYGCFFPPFLRTHSPHDSAIISPCHHCPGKSPCWPKYRKNN